MLLCYDDHDRVRDLYAGPRYHIHAVSWPYKCAKRRIGRELVVTNYPVPTAAERAAHLVRAAV